MRKRVTGLLLALCLCLTLLPGTAGAAEPTTAPATADFTATDNGAEAIKLLNQHKTEGATDSTWVASTKTLTLNGIDFTTTASTAVKLPAGSTIVLADGSANTIRSGNVTLGISGDYKNQAFVNALDAAGTLTIQGGTAGTGTLSVKAGALKNNGDGWVYSSGISVNGDFTVTGGQVTVQGGTVESDGSCFSIGVNMDSNVKNKALLVTGGTLTAIAGEAYEREEGGTRRAVFSRGVYLYRGNVTVSGSGRLRAESVEEMADATLLSNGLYISVGDLNISNEGQVEASGAYGVNISGGGIRLDGGKLTAVSTQTAGTYGNAIYVNWAGGVSGVDTENSANITVNGGTLETENGKIYVANSGAPATNGLFTVSGGTVVNRGRLGGAQKVILSGGTVQTQGVEAKGLTLSGGTLTVREPVCKSSYSNKLYALPALNVRTLSVSGGTLDAAWDWGEYPPVVLPKDEDYNDVGLLVRMPYETDSATFTGGTTILDTGFAGNTALLLKGQLTLGTGVAETGANTDSTGTHKQEYSDTPVVFSNVTRTPVTVSGVTAQDKTYDGTTAATLTAGSLNGVEDSDTVTLGSANVTANFDDANVGENKTVTVAEGGTFDLRGKDAYKYELKTQPTDLTDLKADINPYTNIVNTTKETQKTYVGSGSFDKPSFTGVTVNGVTQNATGTITYTLGKESGKGENDVAEALKNLTAGQTLTIGYSFSGIKNYEGATGGGKIIITAQDRPASGTSGSVHYDITVAKADHGTVSASADRAAAGDTVTVTAQPDSGYVLAALTVTDSQGQEVPLTRLDGGKYTFTMPGSRVEVKAAFAGIAFTDIPEGSPYESAILWAVKNGVTTGTTATTFSPSAPCTRAQAVTFLWRAAGSPEPKSAAMPFTDVSADSVYAKAILWAVERGVTLGTTESTFSPNIPCARGQIVTFLYRAAGSPAVDGAANPFTDVSASSPFLTAILWAVKNGVTTGVTATTFAPSATCTRGQIVTFLYRTAQGR